MVMSCLRFLTSSVNNNFKNNLDLEAVIYLKSKMHFFFTFM